MLFHIQLNYGLNWPTIVLILDSPLPEDDADERILDALVTCPRIDQLLLPRSVGRGELYSAHSQVGIREASASSPACHIPLVSMSEAEADAIFKAMRESGATRSMFFPVRYDESVMRSFARYLEQATLKSISLVNWNRPQLDLHVPLLLLFLRQSATQRPLRL